MNDPHDNAQDDKAILERLMPKFDPVRVVTVHQVACSICGAENVEDTYEYHHEAIDAADFHRKIHRGEV